MIVFFVCIIVSCLGILFTTKNPIVCVGWTLVMMFFSNCIKASYWSIADEAGIPREGAGVATGIMSLIAYSPDIFIFIIIPKFLAAGDKMGDVATGFDYMLFWMIGFAILGIAGGFILKKRTKSIMTLNKQ